MKRIIFILLALNLSSVFAQAEYNLVVPCAPLNIVIESLKGYKERLTWVGKHINDQSILSLWINEKTGSWTLLKKTPEVACIMGTGEESILKLEYPI